jgi:insertion element IS1 protein InsB
MSKFVSMKIQITLECPSCQGTKIVKNGRKNYKNKQNYLCKACSRQFIGDNSLDYFGCNSKLWSLVKRAFVRGCGIRDIASIFEISIGKVLSLLVEHKVSPSPKQAHYDELEVDEFWSFVGNKKNKVWLVYVYHRTTGEIVGWVFGKRNLYTAKKLRNKIKKMGISFDTICMDDWKSFKTAFKDCNCKIGKYWTKGIEGNNCRLRHLIRRAFRKSCNFSKKMENHIIAFESDGRRHGILLYQLRIHMKPSYFL